MKKSLLLGIVGAGALALSAYSQGIVSGNYWSSGPIGGQITFASSGLPADLASYAGLAIDSQFSAQLLYFDGSSYVAVPGSTKAFLGNGIGNNATGAGYSSGIAVTIPGWTSGSVSLEWTAFNTATIGTYAPGTITGSSAPFTMTPVDQSLPVYPDFSSATGYNAFTVSAAPVPEPGTMALAGLGGLGMLMAFRRKKA